MGIFDRVTGRVGEFFGDFMDEVMIPDEIHVQLERASRALDSGDPDLAIELLRRVERLRPGLARTHHLMGTAHLYRGAPQEAARSFRRSIELKEDASSHFYAGLALEQVREWRGAQEHLKRSLALDPSPPYAFERDFARGRVFLSQGRPDKAAKELRKALKHHPDHPDATLSLAQALLLRGRPQDARATYLKTPESPLASAHILAARIAEALHDTPAALQSYLRALNALELTAELEDQALTGAARAALDTGDITLARELAERALSSGRGGPRADLYAMLGMICEREDHPDCLWAPLRHAHALSVQAQPAFGHFADALDQDPEHGLALRGMGRAFLASGNADAAHEYFQRALASPSHRDPTSDLLGAGLAKLLEADAAAAYQLLEEASKTAEEPHPDVWHALGCVALTTGDAAQALVSLRLATDHARTPSHKALIDTDLQLALDRLRPSWNLPVGLRDPGDVEHVLRQLQEYIASDARLVDFLPSTQKLMATLTSPLSIAIVGEFNAGKSTLINALLGEELVPMGVLPTTAHTGILKYGPRQTARVTYLDGDAREVPFEEAKRLMKSNADELAHIEYLYPHPELRAVNIWDTPGFNALHERHEEVATRALSEAEAILWVLDANQVLSQTEFDRIEGLPGGSERLLVVINKVDRLGPLATRTDQVEELVEYVEDFAGEHIAGCYPISALQALQRNQQGLERGAPDDESGFQEFHEHLHTRLIDRAGQIKTLEGTRHLTRLVITLAAFQHGLVARYQTLAGHLEALRTWLGEQAATRPRRVAREELMHLEDRSDFLLRGLIAEIEDALKTRASFVRTTQTLDPEDQEFILGLMRERFESILEHSRERFFQDLGEVETGLAAHVGPIIQGLGLQDARGLHRRLEGFYDESRVLKMLLEERVYGHIIARTAGQLEAAGPATLANIPTHTDQTRWKALLRKLLPELRGQFDRDIEAWYQTFFLAAERLCERVERDLELLELEARVRYDISAIEALVMPPDQEEGESE